MTQISIQLNGQSQTISAPNLESLIKDFYPTQTSIAIAVNNTVIPKSQWAKQTLANGDHIEVIQAVCGG